MPAKQMGTPLMSMSNLCIYSARLLLLSFCTRLFRTSSDTHRFLLTQCSLGLCSLLRVMLRTLHLPPVIALLVLCLGALSYCQILTIKLLK